MSSDRGKPIDFEVIKEPWLVYQLKDNTKLKTRYILTRLFKKIQEKKAVYNFDGQTITVVLISPELKGPTDNRKYSNQELQQSIIQQEVKYDVISEEWNEYYADDGTKIRMKATVTDVKKTDKHDVEGQPIYMVDTNVLLQIKPPKTD